MKSKQTIFVASYPKSGSTWATRLLGDVLNSPTGGCMPSEDDKEVATEGQDRPGSYIVRKGHFVLIDDNTGPVVPRPHRLAWKRLTNEKIVFLVRDPRDICVSGAWHWNKSVGQEAVGQFLDRMIKGNVARCGRWDEYCDKWREFNRGNSGCEIIRYCDLVKMPDIYLAYSMRFFNITFNESNLKAAIQRQSFLARKTQIGNNPKELRRNNMRKGMAGDWKNHFTPAMNDKIWAEFGWMMERLEYSK